MMKTGVSMLLLLMMFGEVCAAPPAAPLPEVLTAPAIKISERQPKKYVGSICAFERVELTARITGIIKKIHFKKGTMVKAGDLLMELEDTTYRAKVASIRAQREQIDAELEYSRIHLDRQANLSSNNAAAISTLDDARRRYRFYKARLDEVNALLLDAENDLSYTKIYAPISGRIDKSIKSEGNLLTPALGTIATIERISPIYVRFSLSERLFRTDFGGINCIRDRAVIRAVLADDTLYPEEAKVAFFDNKIDAKTNTFMVHGIFENRDGNLIPGSFVTVLLAPKLCGEAAGVLLSALQTDGKDCFVYVLDAQNKVAKRKVTVGGINGDYQEILSGVKPGEIVVVDGTHKAKPDMTVAPKPYKQQ